MKTKNRITITEYAVNGINDYGDISFVDTYPNKKEALVAAYQLIQDPDYACVEVEKHIMKRPAHLFGEPDIHQTICHLATTNIGG